MGLRSFLSRRESLLETLGGRRSRGGMKKCQRKNPLPRCSSSVGFSLAFSLSPELSLSFPPWVLEDRGRGAKPPCCSSLSRPSSAALNWGMEPGLPALRCSWGSSWDETRGQLTPQLLVSFVARKAASRPAQLPRCRSPHAILPLWSHAAALPALTHP